MIGENSREKTEKKGFTLIEVLVSVSLFAIIIISATEIFKLSIDGQRSALASQNVQENLKYFLEVTAKEIRMAKRNNGHCSELGYDVIYSFSSNSYGDILKFRNYNDECVTYSLDEDDGNLRFRIARDSQSDYISPDKIRVDSLRFIEAVGSTTQPMITMKLRAWALGQGQFKSDMTIQTSLTSRYYKTD